MFTEIFIYKLAIGTEVDLYPWDIKYFHAYATLVLFFVSLFWLSNWDIISFHAHATLVLFFVPLFWLSKQIFGYQSVLYHRQTRMIIALHVTQADRHLAPLPVNLNKEMLKLPSLATTGYTERLRVCYCLHECSWFRYEFKLLHWSFFFKNLKIHLALQSFLNIEIAQIAFSLFWNTKHTWYCAFV